MNLFRILVIHLCLIIGPFTHSEDKLQIQGNRSISNDTIIHYMNINSFKATNLKFCKKKK